MIRPSLPTALIAALLILTAPLPAAQGDPPREADVVIYGLTSSGVIAAMQVTAMGRSVILVGPETHLGGLSAGGLGWTDSGRKEAIGGLSRGFYQRIKQHYDNPAAWIHEDRTDNRHYRADADAMWVFEPHVAEAVFEDLVAETGFPVVRDAWLDREDSVVVIDGRIAEIATLDGRRYRGAIFIDATYEGDLLAAAGVSFHVGREANATYGETLNGVQTARARSHQFTRDISPYRVPEDPESGLLPFISPDPPGTDGAGDHRVQAYNFRVCLTRVDANRIPFPAPEGYDPDDYLLLLRALEAGERHVFGKFDMMVNGKTDTNNHGSFSTDHIGANYDYPEASYQRRREIIADHARYQQGYFHLLANDPRVPEEVRLRMSQWGLAADEFTDNDGWPHQIYVREARRMVSDFVMTEHHLRRTLETPEPIGMGSYNMDSHNVQRYVAHLDDGRAVVRNEGDIQVNPGGPYQISYRAIVPRREECANLLVPVCLSSSHIAYGSIRMEPVFMILGQSAATAAVLAIEADAAVQDVDYARLSQRLEADGQVLTLPRFVPIVSPR